MRRAPGALGRRVRLHRRRDGADRPVGAGPRAGGRVGGRAGRRDRCGRVARHRRRCSTGGRCSAACSSRRRARGSRSGWSSPAAGAAFTPGLVVAAAWPVPLAAAALTADRTSGRWAGRVELVAVGAARDCRHPRRLLRRSCSIRPPGLCRGPANRLLVASAPDVLHGIGRAGLALAVAWAAGFCALVAAGSRALRAVRRRLRAPVLVPAAAAIALFGADAAHGFARGYLGVDPVDRVLGLPRPWRSRLVAAGALLDRVRVRRTRARVAAARAGLGAAAGARRAARGWPTALGDPSLGAALPARRPVDRRGRPRGRAARRRRARGHARARRRRGRARGCPPTRAARRSRARRRARHDRRPGDRARAAGGRPSRATRRAAGVARAVVAAADRERRALERDSTRRAAAPRDARALVRMARRAAARRGCPPGGTRRSTCARQSWACARSRTACSRRCSPMRGWPRRSRSLPSTLRGSCRPAAGARSRTRSSPPPTSRRGRRCA